MAPITTYKQLQDRVLRVLDEVDDQATTRDLVKDALQAAHSKRVTEERWPFMLWDYPATFVTVAGQLSYSLHQELLTPWYFKNLALPGVTMVQYDEATLNDGGDDWNVDTGDALFFVLRGRTEVAAQPAAASLIAVASSDGTDNGVASVTIKGDTTAGMRTETVTCGASTTASYIKILKVTKSDGWVGTLSITADAGATTILSLFPEELGRTYVRLFFLKAPTSAQTIEYGFYRQPSTLSADNDRPDVPTPFEDVLVYDALLRMAGYNQYDPQTVRLWMDMRDDLLTTMRQVLSAQGESLNMATHYTTYNPR